MWNLAQLWLGGPDILKPANGPRHAILAQMLGIFHPDPTFNAASDYIGTAGLSYCCRATAFLYHHRTKLKEGPVKIIVRKGCAADSAKAIDVVRKSIAELCIADHEGDAREVADWLSNKTEATWSIWLTRSDATVLVAEMANEIVGVGMIDHRGEVLLNYVRPDARFSGVSKAILKSLESVAVTEGVRECFLESTKTAKKFYGRGGYKSANETSLKLTKRL